MPFSIQHKAAAALSLVLAVSSAPLNDRHKIDLLQRGLGLGWLCHFDGPAAPAVDVNLDLPLMLGGLCAKASSFLESIILPDDRLIELLLPIR
jgi:hypothetical protein